MTSYLSSNFGQPKVISILKQFINSKQIPHAILFDGPKNVGQHLVAKNFLKELLLSANKDKLILQVDKLDEPLVKYVISLPRGKGELPNDDPLKKILNTQLDEIKSEISKKISNSYYEINIEKANSIKITSIRDIKKYLSINYDEIPFRLILIEEAHLMGVESQNALLKSLEEPPQGVIFILISDKSEKLLPTIKSRCWNIKFSPLSDSYLKSILIEKFSIEENLAEQIMYFSEGSIHSAFQLLEMGFEEVVDTSINILRYSLGKQYNTAIKLFADLVDEKSQLVVPLMIKLFQTWFLDVKKYSSHSDDIKFKTHFDTVEKFAVKYKNVFIDEIVYELSRYEKMISQNINLNLLILNIIFNISSITKKGN